MSTHRASIVWKRNTPEFTYEGYSRDHAWRFGSGSSLDASAAPEYRGNPSLTNPEEAFVAALSSCHMLTFLALASRAGFVVDSYQDDAEGHLERNAKGRLAVSRVILRPRILFAGDKQPDASELEKLHEQAHRGCFIANSVLTEITVEPPESP